MINVELIRFEAQDVITASVAAPTCICGTTMEFKDLPADWPDNYTCPDCGHVEWIF